MELVLWRHAEAEDEAQTDLARNLTPRGKRQAQAMAGWFDAQIGGRWDDWVIVASPANRAQQTAIAMGRAFRTEPAIAPDAAPEKVLSAAGWDNQDQILTRRGVIIVGHQPTLGMVVARLIDGAAGYVSVKKGAMWWFETRKRNGVAETVLKGMVTPDMVLGGERSP